MGEGETNSAGVRQFTIPVYTTRLRLIALIYGGGLLLWTSLEDNSVLPVVLLGTGLALIAAALWITRRFGGRSFNGRGALIAAALIGAGIGGGNALATAVLMLIKDGLHSHLFPDYAFELIAAMVQRAPLWSVAGAFAGLGLLLAWWAVRQNPQ